MNIHHHQQLNSINITCYNCCSAKNKRNSGRARPWLNTSALLRTISRPEMCRALPCAICHYWYCEKVTRRIKDSVLHNALPLTQGRTKPSFHPNLRNEPGTRLDQFHNKGISCHQYFPTTSYVNTGSGGHVSGLGTNVLHE